MKNIICALLGLTMSAGVFAQNPIKVTEATANNSKGSYNAFTAEIPQSNAKEVAHDLKRRLSAGTKAKLFETNGELAYKGWEDKNIYDKPFNVYALVASTDAGSKVTIWFTYNDTTYFSTKSGKPEAAAASRFVHDFATAEYYLAVKNQYQKERDKLEKLKDELEKNIRAQEKSNQKIAEDKRAVIRAQEDLATNGNDQKEIASAISTQEAEVNKDRAGNPEVYKAALHSLEEQQDAKKHLENLATDLNRKIDNLNKEITGEQGNAAVAKKAETQNTDAITRQKQLIKDLEAKMKAIK